MIEIYSKNHYLPKLKYNYNQLEPFVDATTLEIHHSKHHQAYVDGLNNAEKKLSECRKSGDFSNVKHLKREISFHYSGHILHSLYWKNMCKPDVAKGKPDGRLLEMINNKYGDFNEFIKEFSNTALTVEGSGWALLVYLKSNTLIGNIDTIDILAIEKHQDLFEIGATPLLACDVWEHAYYLKYKNNRSQYISNWFKVVDWDDVEERLEKALSGESFIINNTIPETKY